MGEPTDPDIRGVLLLNQGRSESLGKRLQGVEESARAGIAETDALVAGFADLLGDFQPSPGKALVTPLPPAPDWEELSRRARRELGRVPSHRELLAPAELAEVESELRRFEGEHDAAVTLDPWDLAAAGVVGLIGGILDLVFVGGPTKALAGRVAGLLGCPPGEAPGFPKVSFDKVLPAEHGAMGNHRSNSVSHHASVGGFIAAVRDVLAGTSTHVVAGRIVVVPNSNKGVEATLADTALGKEGSGFLRRLLAAVGIVLRHWQSDANTSLGLPGPWMLLARFLEVGEISDGFGGRLTVAELAASLYSRGMDLRRFVGDSVTVLANEVLVRVWQFSRRLAERRSLAEALDAMGSPRARKMVLSAHLLTASCNAGVVSISGNPLNLNLAHWTATIGALGRHAKWALLEAPQEQERAHLERWSQGLQSQAERLSDLEERLSDMPPLVLISDP